MISANVSVLPAPGAQGENALVTADGAECAVWWRGEIPSLPGERVSILGRYEATSAEAGGAVIDAACTYLREHTGCTLVIGPMDGNTWRRYRFVTDGDTAEPPFFMEPVNAPDYPAHWTAASFTPLAGYSSALSEDLMVVDPREQRVADRLTAAGLTLRPFDITRAEEDLRAIHTLSLVSFADNYLYTPLAQEEFIDQYRRVLSYVRPELTVLAHDPSGRLGGFLFALPNLNELQRGEPIRTVILKTVAVLPGREWAGLGMLLVGRCQRAAAVLGYKRAIHALMHDSNASRNVSGVYAGRPIRRYTLYSRRLRPPLSDFA